MAMTEFDRRYPFVNHGDCVSFCEHHAICAHLAREQVCIRAMQRASLFKLLWIRIKELVLTPFARYGLVRRIHDCADPVVACSCAGGFRYPKGDV